MVMKVLWYTLKRLFLVDRIAITEENKHNRIEEETNREIT